MEKIEFCTGYETTDFDNIATADTACKNAVTIGTGQKEVDIASVSAGAQVAAYGETKLLPLGTTFTHVRVTINREFKIKSESFVESVARACAQIDPTGSSRLVREWQERQQGQHPDRPISEDP